MDKELTLYNDLNYEQTEHPYHNTWCKLLGLENPSLTTAKVCKSSKTDNQTMPIHCSILNKIYNSGYVSTPGMPGHTPDLF